MWRLFPKLNNEEREENLMEETKNKKLKTKRPVDKMKIATRIFASLVIFLMVFSVCGSLLYAIMRG